MRKKATQKFPNLRYVVYISLQKVTPLRGKVWKKKNKQKTLKYESEKIYWYIVPLNVHVWGLTAKGKCLPEMQEPSSEVLDSSEQ